MQSKSGPISSGVAEGSAPFFDLRYIRGVGPKRSLIFQKIGIHCVRDLLYLFPRRYEDRSHFAPLDHLPIGEPITCRAR